MNGIEIMKQSVRVHGATKQRNKAIEEMGELTTALMQERDGRVSADAVITEIADVCITAYELALIYGLEKVTAEIDRKLERLKDRMYDEFNEVCKKQGLYLGKKPKYQKLNDNEKNI